VGPNYWRIIYLAMVLIWLTELGVGQAQRIGALTDDDAAVASDALPNAPGTMSDKTTSNSILGTTPRKATDNPARKFHLVVHPREFGVRLSSGEKLELAVRSRFAVSDLASTAFSAGWSQLRNGPPHYGTDSGAFGERLGALALKQTSQSIFSYGIYASLFHDDPRYYVMGESRGGGVRALYSASRLIIANKDDGRAAINWPKLAAIASATALTESYYPPRDHGFANGAISFGISLWTSILNNEIHEFIGDGFRLRRNRN